MRWAHQDIATRRVRAIRFLDRDVLTETTSVLDGIVAALTYLSHSHENSPATRAQLTSGAPFSSLVAGR